MYDVVFLLARADREIGIVEEVEYHRMTVLIGAIQDLAGVVIMKMMLSDGYHLIVLFFLSLYPWVTLHRCQFHL